MIMVSSLCEYRSLRVDWTLESIAFQSPINYILMVWKLRSYFANTISVHLSLGMLLETYLFTFKLGSCVQSPVTELLTLTAILPRHLKRADSLSDPDNSIASHLLKRKSEEKITWFYECMSFLFHAVLSHMTSSYDVNHIYSHGFIKYFGLRGLL